LIVVSGLEVSNDLLNIWDSRFKISNTSWEISEVSVLLEFHCLLGRKAVSICFFNIWEHSKSVGESLFVVSGLEVSNDLLKIWDGSFNVSNACW
jgi:hypothetical protein